MRFVSAERFVGASAAVHGAQLVAAGQRYDGLALPVEARLAEDGEHTFFGACERWEVVGDDGAPLYDVWLYEADSGTVFRAGTTEVVAEIIQCGLQCDDPALRGPLGEALDDAGILPAR